MILAPKKSYSWNKFRVLLRGNAYKPCGTAGQRRWRGIFIKQRRANAQPLFCALSDLFSKRQPIADEKSWPIPAQKLKYIKYSKYIFSCISPLNDRAELRILDQARQTLSPLQGGTMHEKANFDNGNRRSDIFVIDRLRSGSARRYR